MTTRHRRYIPDRLGRLGQGEWIVEPTPFGRLPEAGKEQPFDMSKPFDLSKAVGHGGNNGRADVAKIETLLGLAGTLDLKKTDGPTGYAGQRLLDAIRTYQKHNGLSVDGRLNPGGQTLQALAQTMQSMGRNGDTVLAHLSREEAEVLHAITDGGSINPKTGLLEFWNGDHESEAGYDAGAANDAQAAKNNAQGNANASARGGDGAGYGDMTPVDAVNRASAALQAQTHARVSRERAAHAAQQAEQTKNGRQREQQAKMQDLIDRNNRVNSVQRVRDTKAKTKGLPGLLGGEDNDAQPGNYSFAMANDDQAAENNAQGNAHASAKAGDPAGYGDMTSVDAVNKARTITQQISNINKARAATKNATVKRASKPTPNPYAGDIAAMVEQMEKNKKEAERNKAENFGNSKPEFTPEEGVKLAKKYANIGKNIGRLMDKKTKTKHMATIGKLLGVYVGLLMGSFGNSTGTDLRDPNDAP